MKVLFVTPEAHPLAKTGGLADVSRSLPISLKRHGIDVRLLMPGYSQAFAEIRNSRVVGSLDPILGISDAILVEGTFPDTNLPVWLIDAPSLFRREGGLYQDKDHRDWPDNALRFAFLSHVGAAVASGRAGLGWVADVVHANDWHTGLLPLLLSQSGSLGPKSIFTVHNMAFQGNFPIGVAKSIGIPEANLNDDGIGFYGQLSFLKAGLRYADYVTTVSPTYGHEIQSPEYGCGMHETLRERGAQFVGILNGIDDDLWNPAIDPHIVENYWQGDITGKLACKTALQGGLGLAQDMKVPVVGFVSRLTEQKMADIVAEIAPWIAAQGAQLAVVGEGDTTIEHALLQVGEQSPSHIAVHVGYDELLAHRLQAGCDIVLAPARFEPCGLTHLYAMRYGALPIVRHTGGLADTVVDISNASIADRTANGFIFHEPNAVSLISALERAFILYRQQLIWRRLQRAAMMRDFSWRASAAKYASLYCEVLGPSEAAEEAECSANVVSSSVG